MNIISLPEAGEWSAFRDDGGAVGAVFEVAGGVDAEGVVEGGGEVEWRDGAIAGVGADAIRGAVDGAGRDAGAGEKDGVASAPVLASG